MKRTRFAATAYCASLASRHAGSLLPTAFQLLTPDRPQSGREMLGNSFDPERTAEKHAMGLAETAAAPTSSATLSACHYL